MADTTDYGGGGFVATAPVTMSCFYHLSLSNRNIFIGIL